MDYFAFRLFSLIALGVVVAGIVGWVAWGISKGRGAPPGVGDDSDAYPDL